MPLITEEALPGGIGVNFDDDDEKTGVRVSYKDAVINFRCANGRLSNAEREQICGFLRNNGGRYFSERGNTVYAAETRRLIDDLRQEGLRL